MPQLVLDEKQEVLSGKSEIGHHDDMLSRRQPRYSQVHEQPTMRLTHEL